MTSTAMCCCKKNTFQNFGVCKMRIIFLLLIYTWSTSLVAAETFRCEMKGDAIGRDLYIKLSDQTKTAVVLDGAIQKFFGRPISVKYRSTNTGRALLRWFLPVGGSAEYLAALNTEAGRINLTVIFGGVSDSPVTYGARGTCKPTASASFLDGYPRQEKPPSKMVPKSTAAICPADGGMPKQDGTWHYNCHNKAYRKVNRVSCKTYPCW